MTIHGKTPVSPINNVDLLLQVPDLLPTPIFVKDQNLKFVFSNEAHCKIISSEADKLSGLSDADFYPTHQAKGFMAAAKAVSDSQEPHEFLELATSTHGSTVYSLTRKARVATSIRTARGIETSVEDNVPGISAENPSKIGEPLFTAKSFGTGLGLPAVEKTVEEHDCGLDVTSAPGKGSCFTAWFPIIETLEEAA